MNIWFLLLALAPTVAPAQPAGRYVAVTETEYELELILDRSGTARIKRYVWEADHSAADVRSSLKGHWIYRNDAVEVTFASGKAASFLLVSCLPYAEFGRNGCSPGLKLIKTSLPTHWGLQRFGLWRADLLRAGS
ncbi:hypothetical protein [Xanthomonas sacchari]|uniref:hypothetical protein n=1 Tax=Xanthomonas sacchari TaxID=56458 RepID=UPI00225E116D|nr:hypothetical protein [Xanthomonas sacchari]MCW0436145.1 hypothetical protein [Xanthomonas sacchari]